MPTNDTQRQEDGKAGPGNGPQHFHAIVEATLDGVLILDAVGKVLYCNPSAEALLSSSAQALTGTRLDLPVQEGDVFELELMRPSKGLVHVQVRVQKVTWHGQEARLVVVTDITKRKATEEELESARQAQLRMKDEFLSRVSHELRSPLNAVYQYVTILLDGLAGAINDEQREYLGIALRNVKQLQTMIGDLLDVTRSRSGKLVIIPREMDLARAVEESLDTLRPEAQAKKLSLSSSLPGPLPSAFADPQRVQQIIVNLVGNAIKFTPEGGMIRVSARVCDSLPEKAEPDAVGAVPQQWLEIAVADTGCGVDAEDHERIFRHLYQVDKNIDQKRMGLGLGLYICRDLVTRLGGRIWVESRLGQGSTFYFTLPVFSPEHAVLSLIHDRLSQTKLHGGKFAVVVVDSEAAADKIRPAWEVLLAKVGAKAVVAAYAGSRFVSLVDIDDSQTEPLRSRLRRAAKDACFQVDLDLCRTLAYGVAVGVPEADSAAGLLARAVAAAVTEKSLLAQKRLMVVDDDEQCLMITRRFMTALGVASVKTATSGAGLFTALEQEIPDLIVLDIQMPGMNGHEIIGRLKEKAETAVIPVVVVSGYVGEPESMEGQMPGTAIPVLSKLKLGDVQRWVQYLL